MRVTHLVFDLNGGGMESLVAAMAARFAGGPVVLSAVSLSGRPGRVGSSIRHLLDQYHVTRPVPGVSMLAPLGVARLVRETRPDVVHLHSGAWYKGALAARLASAPRVVYTEHGREHDDPALSRWLDRRASRWTDTVVAVSDRLARYLGEVVGVEERRIRTVPNGVDIDAFSPGFAPLALRRDLGIPEGAVVIGSVGRLEPVKRYDRLITALGRLRAPGMVERPVHLVLVGDGSRRAALEEQVRREGLSEAARLVGWTDRPADFYRLLDVFALTSDSEGASVSLMEAMACGIAPVVMDVGANAEILGPELADQVTPAGDLDVFVRTAAHMLCSPDRRQHAGRLARERVGRCYNLDRMLAWYEDLYRQRATAPASSAGGRT